MAENLSGYMTIQHQNISVIFSALVLSGLQLIHFINGNYMGNFQNLRKRKLDKT